MKQSVKASHHLWAAKGWNSLHKTIQKNAFNQKETRTHQKYSQTEHSYTISTSTQKLGY